MSVVTMLFVYVNAHDVVAVHNAAAAAEAAVVALRAAEVEGQEL